LRRLSLRGIESDKPSVCMRRIKSQFLDAVEKKIGRIDSGKSQKPHPCKRRKSAAPGVRSLLSGFRSTGFIVAPRVD